MRFSFRDLSSHLQSSLRENIALVMLLVFSCHAFATTISGQAGELSITPPNMTNYASQGDTLTSIALRFTERD